MKANRIIMILILVMSVFLLNTAPVSAKATPTILPPNSRVQGHTYAEWSAITWQTMLTIPASENPGLGVPISDCFVKRIGNVGLFPILFAPYGPFKCNMPTGMMLFMNIASAECSTLEQPPYYGGNKEELRACALNYVYTNLKVTIDGSAIKNLSKYLVLSPLYQFTVPADNFFGVSGGTVGKSVAYGTYFMLAPLDPGQHTVSIHADLPYLSFSFDQIYNITVTNERWH